MPLVKTTLSLVSNDSSLIDPDRHSAILVALCRQIGELAQCCDLLVGELVAEVEKITNRTQSLVERTSKLAIKVESLDDGSAILAAGSLIADKTLVRRSSVTDYRSRTHRNLFTPFSRPDAIRTEYQKCMTSPAGVIAQCDIYRTDGRRGAAIFSPSVICIHEQRTDDFLTISRPAIVKRRHTLGRSIKSLRPPNRTRPTSLPVMPPIFFPSDETLACGSMNGDSTDVNNLTFEPEAVQIDTTGSNFFRQMAASCNPIVQCQYEDDTPTETLRDRKYLSSWRRTICGVSDLVFDEVDVDLPLKEFQKDFRSISVTITRSGGSAVDRSTLKQFKSSSSSSSTSNSSKRFSCSWKQSLKSLIRGVRTKSSDLWAPSDISDLTDDGKYEKVSGFQRSSSLPRSMKCKVNEVNQNARSKSKSLEGQLDVSIDITSKPDVLRTNSATLSRSRSSLVSRSRCRPKSMEVRIMSLDEYGKPFIREQANNEMVHINLPEQPWTKPFANVRLRSRAVRAESEKYQSSSGHWSGEQSFEGEIERLSMTSEHPRDSAVSLSCDVNDRLKSSSDDCLTLKTCSSDGTLTDMTQSTYAYETTSIHHSPHTSVFHPSSVNSSVVVHRPPLSSFRKKESANCIDNNGELRTIVPTPPSRSSSTPSTSILPGKNKSSELMKLARLAKKMAAQKSRDNTVTVAELSTSGTNKLLQFKTLQPTVSDGSSEQITTNATVTSQIAHKKVMSLARNGSRDVILSLIAEGSDETDESGSANCCESMTSATWPRHNISAMTSPSERTTSAVGDIITSKADTQDKDMYCEPLSVVINSAGTPTPVSARLIITSPVASRASFVDNPHRRAMCQPLSRDIQATPCCDTPTPDLAVIPTHSAADDTFSIGFPASTASVIIPSSYGRSWYDGTTDAVSDISNANNTNNNNNNNNNNTVRLETFRLCSDKSGSSLSRHVSDIECHSDTRSVSSQESSVTSSSSSDKSHMVSAQHLDDVRNGITSKQRQTATAKRRASTSGLFAVHSVKQHKARAAKTRRSISGSERMSTYNVLAATHCRAATINERHAVVDMNI